MAECKCGDGLQTEKHIFWNCKWYEDQQATVMDILSETSKKGYPKSVTELLRLEEKDLCKTSVTSSTAFLYLFKNRYVRQ
jgi:hypothetical protein